MMRRKHAINIQRADEVVMCVPVAQTPAAVTGQLQWKACLLEADRPGVKTCPINHAGTLCRHPPAICGSLEWHVRPASSVERAAALDSPLPGEGGRAEIMPSPPPAAACATR